MKTDIRQTENLYECAYSNEYQGFEFIYIKTNDKKILLFENRLAIEGIWLNDLQVVKMVEQFQEVFFKETEDKIICVGSEIIIESYKHRGLGIYDETGMLKKTPDFDRSIRIFG
ncbi:hypothetical protein ACM55F_10080 [Flavobacterium sp. XS2P12]|uniref:hypothetical protein n=1 Tax=Flavobacterium melibiosi TaxID=3398734 RepID=UPI003A84DE66